MGGKKEWLQRFRSSTDRKSYEKIWLGGDEDPVEAILSSQVPCL
jgi:hypothetical protein